MTRFTIKTAARLRRILVGRCSARRVSAAAGLVAANWAWTVVSIGLLALHYRTATG